ncbi:MAG: hypothetical protein ABSF28_08580 [Terracidiphilus sp.]
MASLVECGNSNRLAACFDVVAAQGNGGQKIYLVPHYDLVAVFTAGGYNAESTPPNAIMAKIILPALIEAASRGNASSPSH